MIRNRVISGIILKTNRIAEIHKGLTLFTGSEGLLQCIAHGAWKEKSKLRSSTQLFSYAKFHLYFNPVNNSCKVSEIENIALYEGIRESIIRYYSASLWAEIILKSFGGGENSQSLFRLVIQALELLNSIAEQDTAYLLVQFLWRFLSIIGFKPEINVCHECNKSPVSRENEFFYFHPTREAFFCDNCCPVKIYPVSPGMRLYLNKTLLQPIKRVMAIKIEKKAIENLKQITYHILETLLEIRLKSLKSGEGIL